MILIWFTLYLYDIYVIFIWYLDYIIKFYDKKNIKLNITAVYNSNQTKKILKCINKKTKVIISIFAGRAADVGKNPIPEFKRSIKYKTWT